MILARDLDTWHGYLSRLESEFDDETGGAYIWTVEWTGPRTFERAFKGPWKAVRGHVTREFRQWVEESGRERVTITEWVRRQREERENEYLDWLDSQS